MTPTSATATVTWASTPARKKPCALGKRVQVPGLANDEIRFLAGSEVKQIIGSNAYTSALLHMGGGHVHSLNLLLGEAKALAGLGVKHLRTQPRAWTSVMANASRCAPASGSVKASKLLWACDSFLNKLEPELHSRPLTPTPFS